MSFNTSEIEKFHLSRGQVIVYILGAILFYGLYICFADFIHIIRNSIPESEVPSYIVWDLRENDGIELPVFTLAFPVYLGIQFLIFNFYNSVRKDRDSKGFILFIVCIAILFFANMIGKEKIDVKSIIYCVLTAIILNTIPFVFKVYKKWYDIVLFITLIGLGFIINMYPSCVDYELLFGPANKMLQGEKLGTFYMQYNMLLTSLVCLLCKFRFTLWQIHIVMLVSFAVWILLYKKTASLLFKHGSVVFFFIVTIILVRGIAPIVGPVSSPQCGPLRLDLWLPLLLIIYYKGINSVFTAAAFALVYICDH